ncbi:MAG TPA: hypothetical protein PK014_00450 [Thermoanaerobaculia bacterium]|nr:hypothetical protein [Thermoanaerobaculia bacterium]HXK66942.1 hypothetical protein [Thermoanaerobaculia bacterium]
MNKDSLRLLVILAIVFVVIAVIYNLGHRPVVVQVQPVTAWVVLPDGELYSNGKVMSGPGPLDIHAVVKMEEAGGKYWYATDVARLKLDGAIIPETLIRSWTDPDVGVRIVYFSVEPENPYYLVNTEEDLSAIQFRHYYLAGGESMWSYTGPKGAKNVQTFSEAPVGTWAGETLGIGTMRFRVMVDFFRPDAPISSVRRVASPGKDQLDSVPTLISGLGDPSSSLFALSSYANLPGAGFGSEVSESVRGKLLEMIQARWVYGTVLWTRILNRFPDPFRVYFDGGRVLHGEHSLQWNRDVFPGDMLSMPESSSLLIEDDGDGFLTADDRVMTKVQGPMCVTTLQSSLPGETYMIFVPTGHEPAR